MQPELTRRPLTSGGAALTPGIIVTAAFPTPSQVTRMIAAVRFAAPVLAVGFFLAHCAGGRSRVARRVHRAVQRQGPRRLARVGHPRQAAARRPRQAHARGASASRSTTWTADAKKHWSVENGELVNDGNGAYLTTDKDYGDIELLIDYKTVAEGRQRHLPPRHAAGADLGLRPRKAASGTSAPTRARAACGTTAAGAPGKDPLVLADKPFGEWNQLPHPPGRRADDGLPQRQARRRSRPAGELLGPQAAAARKRADPAPDPRRRDPLAEHLRPRDPAGRGERASSRKHGATGFETVFNGKDFDRLGRAGRELRGRGRRHRLQAEEGRQHLHEGRVRRLRRPARVPAAARRQQRPGDPLPRQGRQPPTAACASSRCSTTPPRSTPSSTRGSTTARPTAWSPAHRGYLRPVGEWNFEEVTVKGPTIKVELNGTRDPRRRPEQGHGVHGQHAAPRQGPHHAATSASPATTTRSRSATSRSRSWSAK